MLESIIQYIVTLVVMLLIDGLWLYLTNKKLYKNNLGDLMLENPNWSPAIIFYLLYPLAIVLILIHPYFAYAVSTTCSTCIDISLTGNMLIDLYMKGILFGVVSYATYDLTNLATLKGWSLKITIIDMLWGGLMTFLTLAISIPIINILYFFFINK